MASLGAYTTYNLSFKGIGKSRSTLKGVGSGARFMNNLTIQERRKEQQDDVFSSKPTFNKRPRTVFCYICGREYGTASL